MKSKCFSLLLLFLFSLVSIGAYAQVKVEGSVFDETDNPLGTLAAVLYGGVLWLLGG